MDETKDSCSYSEDRFFLDFRGDWHPVMWKILKMRVNIWVFTALKGYSDDNDLLRITWNRKITWQFEAF